MTEHHHDERYEHGVMADVGPGAGALVIYTSDELHGDDIEISPSTGTSDEAAGSAQAHKDKAGESNSGQVGDGDPGFP